MIQIIFLPHCLPTMWFFLIHHFFIAMSSEIPESKHLHIKQWAEEDRPREKLMLKGNTALSDAELIAILIGSGSREMTAVELAKHILQKVDNNLHELAKLSIKDLQSFKGIGEAKAISIVSALELGRRRKASDLIKREKVTCAEDIYEIMKPNLLDLKYEEFWVLYLNQANIVMKKERISQGGVARTIVDVKLILKKALEELSQSIILVHNHPSGNTKPSKSDVDLTKQLKMACGWLEIVIMDHLIFCDHGYFSFAEGGYLI